MPRPKAPGAEAKAYWTAQLQVARDRIAQLETLLAAEQDRRNRLLNPFLRGSVAPKPGEEGAPPPRTGAVRPGETRTPAGAPAAEGAPPEEGSAAPAPPAGALAQTEERIASLQRNLDQARTLLQEMLATAMKEGAPVQWLEPPPPGDSPPPPAP
jgi:hypothetical protein